MRLVFLILSLSVLSVFAQRQQQRLRVRPSEEEQTAAPQVRTEYFTAAQQQADDSEEQEQPQQFVSRQNYARAQQLRPAPASLPSPRSKSEPRAPPVQTIRNYNKLNDDGSFTFGYEAADGSFKEETRGTDCVVRGKYGYIDPDGNKREFSYVSGNPCDPNAVNQEDEELNSNQAVSGEENIPENIPNRPIRPLKKKPTTTLFQQNYNPSEEEQEENVPAPKPGFIRPFPQQFNQIDEDIQPQILRQSRPRPTTPAQPVRSSVRILRPTTPELPATTFRPQLLQVSSETPQSPFLSKTTPGAPSPSTPAPNSFESSFKNFQLENNVVGGPKPAQPSKPLGGSSPLYSTELVFDPATGQYQTVLYQQVPKSSPFSAPQGPPGPGPLTFFPRQQFPQHHPQPVYQQQLFQNAHAQQVSQSTNLFQQQQQKQAAVQRIPPTLLDPSPQKFNPEPIPSVQRFPPEPKFAASQRLPAPAHLGPQPNFYFVSPDQRTNLATGQIDSFLRGHNLQF